VSENRIECPLCRAGTYQHFGYIGSGACDHCGAEWTYDEGDTLTEKSMRDLWGKVPRWIPVAERLPDLEDDDGGTPNVLGYYPDYPPDIQLVWYTGNGWEDGDGSGRDVKAPSHWMPLPAPPTDSK
jgi:hypothetical protein